MLLQEGTGEDKLDSLSASISVLSMEESLNIIFYSYIWSHFKDESKSER